MENSEYRYTFITPTICRESLIGLCNSIDMQTVDDYEHLVVVDIPIDELTTSQTEVLKQIDSEKRTIYNCNRRHANYGHTCRHDMWSKVNGKYIFYVDDDDYLADRNVLKSLSVVTQPWAIFPVMHYGSVFFNDPPGMCKTGTGMFICMQELGPWIDSDAYEADGEFVESLKQFPYQLLNTSRPLVVQPKPNRGL